MERRRIVEDQEDRKLAEDIRDLMSRLVDHKFRTRKIRGTQLSGGVPKSQGGTGTSNGATANPIPLSVTNASVAVGADIDPGKLDQELLEDLAYTLVKAFLIAGTGITITPNDGLHTLTFGSILTTHGIGAHTDVELSLPVAEGDILVFISDKWRNIHGITDPETIYWDSEALEWDGSPITWG